ncbi:uncharacterized protein LOC113203227 isoform X2 [Frankliniella occidentalis]|uniref:Uncharacterized protein LOC113203227 isoform X2 n=1 Tax=Frankliniella occidentalis TaxID=133901 RepID=A0A9C6U638_FRAOC|nr:uncharacterized protein LOC113203227 isoform X2 [Frankliniella occidentalis]XP_052125990.1 uncharacterized protein LOC113203227 isoform X2 [Frankliniella occidentalis]XP_052125991.1 uncharacterized protein LOC113203227 isoform X2 [Frankliniella occidentalis]XP_052125992.1 uncharacterized protein LOC113203227 isoform X2 [Frankliniella occidentalis]XP_052125993.1 uncharacterized protein LOC113203227 isoform X2 [Frankliniella occidentalis]
MEQDRRFGSQKGHSQQSKHSTKAGPRALTFLILLPLLPLVSQSNRRAGTCHGVHHFQRDGPQQGRQRVEFSCSPFMDQINDTSIYTHLGVAGRVAGRPVQHVEHAPPEIYWLSARRSAASGKVLRSSRRILTQPWGDTPKKWLFHSTMKRSPRRLGCLACRSNNRPGICGPPLEPT